MGGGGRRNFNNYQLLFIAPGFNISISWVGWGHHNNPYAPLHIWVPDVNREGGGGYHLTFQYIPGSKYSSTLSKKISIKYTVYADMSILEWR